MEQLKETRCWNLYATDSKCTILATISEGSKETYHQWSVAKGNVKKTDLEVAYNLQQAQAEMENSMFIKY